MIILGIDTASSLCAVSAVSAGRVIAVRTSDRPRTHAELLLGMIEECMDAAAPGRRNPDAVALSGGPGSFTGLRIGFSVAKGLCAAGGSALVLVPTFEAWALAAAGTSAVPEGSMILTVIPAGRSEAYAASFRRAGDGVEKISGPSVVPAERLPGLLPGDGKSVVVGESRAVIRQWFPSAGESVFLGVADDRLDTATRIALIGIRKLGSGPASDPVTAEPMYIRDLSITLPREKRG